MCIRDSSWWVHMSSWSCSWPTPLPWTWPPSWWVHMSSWSCSWPTPSHGHGHLHGRFTCPGEVVVGQNLSLCFVSKVEFCVVHRFPASYFCRYDRVLDKKLIFFGAIWAPPSEKTMNYGDSNFASERHGFCLSFDWLKLVDPF